jgi:FKBP-type peptidyl-prolyl cis-trans isomerase FkpA
MRSPRILLVVLTVLSFALAACGEEPASTTGAGGDDQPSCPEDVVTSDTGLEYRELECGGGPEASRGDVAHVHYTGTLEDGTEFDSSVGGKPFTFVLGAGQVIAGWDEGIEGMSVGGKRELTIPPELGYGEMGSPPVIPPNAVLIFEVELVGLDQPTD